MNLCEGDSFFAGITGMVAAINTIERKFTKNVSLRAKKTIFANSICYYSKGLVFVKMSEKDGY